MIENQDKKNNAEHTGDAADPGREDTDELIDLSEMEISGTGTIDTEAADDDVIDLSAIEAMETMDPEATQEFNESVAKALNLATMDPDATQELDEIIDLGMLEADSMDADDVIDLSMLEGDSMKGEDDVVEDEGVLDLTEEFRLNGSEIEDEYEEAVLDLEDAIEDEGTFEDEALLEDDSFFDLTQDELEKAASEAEEDAELVDLSEADQIDDDDVQFDLADMVESDPDLAFDKVDDEDFSLNEFYDDHEDAGDAETVDDEASEEALLEKLDDYFGDEDDFGAQEAGAVPEDDAMVVPGNVEDAMERIIEKRYGGKLDQMVNDIIAQKVSDELDALKSIIVDSLKSRK